MRPQQLQNQDWKQIRRTAIPFGFRWMFRPVRFPSEAGLPESDTLIEVPDPLLWALGGLAVICFVLGIIGISGSLFLVMTSLLIFLCLHLATTWQIQLWKNADEQFHQAEVSKIINSKCD